MASPLEILNARAATCTRCLLHQNREHSVPGEGPAPASILVVGEAPGMMENKSGRPFVGPSGSRLDTWLHAAGIGRSSIHITNTVLCQPLGNRDPSGEELEACSRFLHTRIILVQPRVIVTLGRVARSVLKNPYKHPKESFTCTVLSTVHPSYACRMEETKIDVGAIRTFQKAKVLSERAEAASRTSSFEAQDPQGAE